MPLTTFQHELLAELARAPNDARYLAGGAALHFTPSSLRYSDDLDFFADSEARVAEAFAKDSERLRHAGFRLDVEVSQPGFIRAAVHRHEEATRVDWAHDSAWRFLPLISDPLGGWLLHPIDLAINKVLALAGRDEPRDFVDVLFVHREVLPFAALAWATAGKDSGFTPLSLLELLKRRGRYRPEDFARLSLARPFDVTAEKATWLAALSDAASFARMRPSEEIGCLYFSPADERFVVPGEGLDLKAQGIVAHFGAPGGVVPRMADVRLAE